MKKTSETGTGKTTEIDHSKTQRLQVRLYLLHGAASKILTIQGIPVMFADIGSAKNFIDFLNYISEIDFQCTSRNLAT